MLLKVIDGSGGPLPLNQNPCLRGGCGSVGKAGCLPITTSVVRSLAPPVYMSKCPWARCWILNCSWWLRHWCELCVYECMVSRMVPDVCERVNADLCCISTLSSWKTGKYKCSPFTPPLLSFYCRCCMPAGFLLPAAGRFSVTVSSTWWRTSRASLEQTCWLSKFVNQMCKLS